MAKLQLNGWIKDMRGASGDVVFKRTFGRLIVAQKGTLNEVPPTEGQLAVRQRFTAASRYARNVLADPVLRLPYVAAAEARNTSAFGLAAGDYLKLPEVTEVDLAEYFGRVGDPIKVTAGDDFGLVSLKVTIRNEAGTVLETGLATANAVGTWVYRATTVAPTNQNLTIEAEAKDRPGHERTRSESWHA